MKMETERLLEVASEAVPRTALYVGSVLTKGTVIQSGQDRPVRKSSFRACKPQGRFLWPSMASGVTISGGFTQRKFSMFSKVDNSDLKPLFDEIGHVHVSSFTFLSRNRFQFDVCLVEFYSSKFLI